MRAAQAGIAIASGEASVAAPFTTPHVNVSVVPNLLRYPLEFTRNITNYIIIGGGSFIRVVNLLFL